MTLVILFFSIGIVLLALEVFVPGGILGIIGGISLFTGCILSFVYLGSNKGFIAIGIALLAVISVFYFEIKILPKTRLGKRLFLHREITGTAAPALENLRDLIGKTATSVTVLSPSGYVSVDGNTYEAVSQSGQISKDTELEIVSANSFQITVRTKA